MDTAILSNECNILLMSVQKWLRKIAHPVILGESKEKKLIVTSK